MPTRRFRFLPLLLTTLALPYPAHALETKPVELGSLGHASVTASDEEGAVLTIKLPDGKEQREADLGDEFQPFGVPGRAEVRLQALDLDGDGREEILARTNLPGGAGGALYVFKWKESSGRFVPVESPADDDFLFLEPKSPVQVEKTGLIDVREQKNVVSYRVKEARFVPGTSPLAAPKK